MPQGSPGQGRAMPQGTYYIYVVLVIFKFYT